MQNERENNFHGQVRYVTQPVTYLFVNTALQWWQQASKDLEQTAMYIHEFSLATKELA